MPEPGFNPEQAQAAARAQEQTEHRRQLRENEQWQRAQGQDQAEPTDSFLETSLGLASENPTTPGEERIKRSFEPGYKPEEEPSYWEMGEPEDVPQQEKHWFRLLLDSAKVVVLGPEKQQQAQNLADASTLMSEGLFGGSSSSSGQKLAA